MPDRIRDVRLGVHKVVITMDVVNQGGRRFGGPHPKSRRTARVDDGLQVLVSPGSSPFVWPADRALDEVVLLVEKSGSLISPSSLSFAVSSLRSSGPEKIIRTHKMS